jgi:hypothetical protein
MLPYPTALECRVQRAAELRWAPVRGWRSAVVHCAARPFRKGGEPIEQCDKPSRIVYSIGVGNWEKGVLRVTQTTERKAYHSPKLEDFGQVSELTQTGTGAYINFDGTTYTSFV